MRRPTRATRSRATTTRRSNSRGRRPARRTPPCAGLIRRQLGPPGPEQLERVPESCLRRLVVERRIDVRDDERLDRRREPLDLPGRPLEPVSERELDAVQELERVLAHHDDELRL